MYNKKTDEYYIIDLKTSYRGWSKKKKQESKDQLLYYKKYYAKQNNIDENKIIPMFIILKRKSFGEEKLEFKVNRVSKFIPSSKRAMKESIENFHKKIKKVFIFKDNEAFININKQFVLNPSKENCKYCPYKNTKYCKEGK
jgi:hypothetical protein